MKKKAKKIVSVENFYFDQSWVSKIFPLIITSIIAFIVYSPSFRYPFQFDDIASIAKYYHIRHNNPFESLGRGRWFSNWLNCLNYKIGKFDPFSYRLFNLLIHIFAGVALFILIYNLCRLIKNRPFLYENAYLLAGFTSGLFLLHPVQTQTVSYVIQARLEGMAGLFVLISLCFFVSIFRVQKKWMKLLCTGLFVLFSIISCATKEIVVVIPFLALILDWFFISQEDWKVFKKHLVWYGLLVIIFLALLAHYLGKKLFVDILSLKASVPNNRGNVLTDHAMYVITAYDFFISQFKVIWHYAFIFFWPSSMCVEYDWKICSSFFAADSLFPFIGIILVLMFLMRNIIQKKWFAFNVGVLWFLIALSPRCSFVPAPELLCDYKTYLASVGIFFIMALVLVKFAHNLYSYFEKKSLLFSASKFWERKEHVLVA